MRGARTWLIERGFTSFCVIAENSAPVLAWAKEEVQKMLHEEELNRDMKELNVRVQTDLYVRFNKLLPEIGSPTWFVRKYVHLLVNDLQDVGISLEDRIESVINRSMQPDLPEIPA